MIEFIIISVIILSLFGRVLDNGREAVEKLTQESSTVKDEV
jgi:hypothetical protein